MGNDTSNAGDSVDGAVLTDISAQRLADQALQREKEFLTRIMETSPVGIVALNAQGYPTHVNPKALSIFGITREQAIGRRFNAPDWQTTDENGQPIAERNTAFRRVEQRREPVYGVRQSVARADGTRMLLSINASPLLGPSGEFEGIVATLEDISRAWEAERALHSSEEKYRFLFENLTVGFGLHEMIYDEQGRAVDYRFLELNPAFERMTGISRENAVGKTVREIIPGIEQHWIDTYAKVVQTGQPLAYSNAAVALGRHYEVWAFRPSPGRFATIFTDVTERKRADEVLLRTQKLESIAVLAGGIAHDFNNLLSGLFGFVELASECLPTYSEAKRYLDSAMAGHKRATALTRQLLTFSRGGNLVKSTIDLRPMVEQAVQFALSGSACSADFRMPGDLWPCSVDANQLSQAINNIVINARQAMAAGGTITVTASNCPPQASGVLGGKGRREVEIAISDKGCGIPSENIERIFDPFFTTKSQGTGLGLASAHSIIKNHGGRIEVTSELGKGSAFHVFLPASPDIAEESAQAMSNAKPGQSLHILVMDDEELVLAMLKTALTRLGHEVACARDGAEAIAAYRLTMESGRRFDAVILDLTVAGGMGGLETIGELRKLDPKVTAIVSSGYAENPALAAPADFGFIARLVKPVTMSDIRAVLDCVANRKR
jgi:PAS domain S-box-containing protein